jgi:TPR repeat protein
MRWTRKAADNGYADACSWLAQFMYRDQPYAREAGIDTRPLFGST